MQSIKDRKIRSFKNKNYIISKYENKILIKEANLFCDWYIKKIYLKIIKINFPNNLKKS